MIIHYFTRRQERQEYNWYQFDIWAFRPASLWRAFYPNKFKLLVQLRIFMLEIVRLELPDFFSCIFFKTCDRCKF